MYFLNYVNSKMEMVNKVTMETCFILSLSVSVEVGFDYIYDFFPLTAIWTEPMK